MYYDHAFIIELDLKNEKNLILNDLLSIDNISDISIPIFRKHIVYDKIDALMYSTLFSNVAKFNNFDNNIIGIVKDIKYYKLNKNGIQKLKVNTVMCVNPDAYGSHLSVDSVDRSIMTEENGLWKLVLPVLRVSERVK